MNRDEVRWVVLKHIASTAEGLPVEAIDTARSLTDYHVDSIDMVEIVSRSMRELKVKLPRTELREVTNIDGLIDLLHQTVLDAEKGTGAPPSSGGPTTPPSGGLPAGDREGNPT
jgi:acyl carrier protein